MSKDSEPRDTDIKEIMDYETLLVFQDNFVSMPKTVIYASAENEFNSTSS